VLPLTAVPRALVNHDTRGLVKIVADEVTDKGSASTCWPTAPAT
jgi:pyruvate/2-oxoglutarate dehydrogenase complex dihydrolipoamide dehydrogenase (E3) component